MLENSDWLNDYIADYAFNTPHSRPRLDLFLCGFAWKINPREKDCNKFVRVLNEDHYIATFGTFFLFSEFRYCLLRNTKDHSSRIINTTIIGNGKYDES